MKRHHVAQQMLEEQQYKKDNGPIDIVIDQLWKYSGETEKTSVDFEEFDINFRSYYRKRIKERNIYLLLNKKESKIIDYFYQNSNTRTIQQMGKDLGISGTTIQQTISKHIKIQRDDTKNTG
jgi:DNA-directed RNA polymerase specialized sigma subunit